MLNTDKFHYCTDANEKSTKLKGETIGLSGKKKFSGHGEISLKNGPVPEKTGRMRILSCTYSLYLKLPSNNIFHIIGFLLIYFKVLDRLSTFTVRT